MNKGIQNFYAGISDSYEFVNRLITFGLDSIWRRRMIKKTKTLGSSQPHWLDICTGTGQLARQMARVAPNPSLVVGMDFSSSMIHRARNFSPTDSPTFMLGDAMHLPFEDNSFGLIAISFATRNLAASPGHLQACLREFHRVLRPGGYFLNLETSQPRHPMIRKLYHTYVQLSVPLIGKMISGKKPPYSFLANSIQKFFSPEEYNEQLKQAGFDSPSVESYLFGAVAMHWVSKPTP